MRPARAAIALSAALLLAAADPPRELHGPLSDFWARVKQDWSDRLTGLNHGPLQTAIWVALIWDGPDRLAVDRVAQRLQEREAKRWVRSQITRDRYSDLSRREISRMQALRQHVILMGTPADNPLVGRALEATPLRAGPGFVSVGRRRLAGDDLLVFAITPNPVEPGHYALVITGSSAAATLQAADVPYGETDYVIYRGRKVVDRGFFQWSGGRPDRETLGAGQPFQDHSGWSRRDTARFRVHFDPAATADVAVARLGRRIDSELEEAAVFYGIATAGLPRIDLYVYASLDGKTDQTADMRPAHVDPGDGALHVVWSEAPGGIDAWDVSLAARALLRISPDWGADAPRELPGLRLALALACRDTFETIPLAAWRARSARDTGYLPMDLLFLREPEAWETGDVSVLDAAGFLRHTILTQGARRMAQFSRTATRDSFRDRFKEIYGMSIHQAETRWLAEPVVVAAGAEAGGRAKTDRSRLETGAGTDPGPLQPVAEAMQRRDDAEAFRLLAALPDGAAVLTLRARLFFRAGKFDSAVRAASAALAHEGGRALDYAWARLTLGRARAMLGLLTAARADLTMAHETDGPAQVAVIAELWLEHLGQPLDQHAAHRLLLQQADVDLMNFEWEKAEASLRRVLAADPQSREAHAALGQVYLSKYQYWYDWMLLDRELFPAESQADPETYRYLADKGREELKKAESLAFGEQERWMSETGPVEPGVDQPMVHLLMAKAHLMKGAIESARRELETALALEPSDDTLTAWIHLYLGRVAAAEGDAATARREYELVLKLRVGGDVTKRAMEESSALAFR